MIWASCCGQCFEKFNDDGIFDQLYIIVLPIRKVHHQQKYQSNVLNWSPLIAERGTYAKIWNVEQIMPCDVFQMW